MKYLTLYNRGRFGNSVFRFLASRLFSIIFGYTITFPNSKFYYKEFSDENFIKWMNELIQNNKLLIVDHSSIIFTGYYQHDTIYKVFKSQLITYILNNPNDIIETDKEEKIKCINILGDKPTINYTYKTVVHLRIEDFIELGLAMDPRCLKDILEKCEKPFLFVHKEVENDNDRIYIKYIKDTYPDSHFYSEDIISCYNVMRHAELLVCSHSTVSWTAALFNEINVKTYMPKNYGTLTHETCQYPNDNTEIYEWKIISKEELIAL